MKGRNNAPTKKPIAMAAIVVAPKNPSVRAPSLPKRRTSPRPATPWNSAVATSGITTIERRFKNSVPNGRSHRANASSAGDCVRAAVRPSASPATSPIAIQMWLLIAPTVLLPGPPGPPRAPGTMIIGATSYRNG